MTEKIINRISEVASANNPFDSRNEGTRSLWFGKEAWIGYAFGGTFILIGLACFFLYPRAKRKANEYRQEQLIEYNKQKKLNTKNYSQTGMYLPAWEKAKMFAPVFFGMVFCIVGISWIVGNTLTTL